MDATCLILLPIEDLGVMVRAFRAATGAGVLSIGARITLKSTNKKLRSRTKNDALQRKNGRSLTKSVRFVQSEFAIGKMRKRINHTEDAGRSDRKLGIKIRLLLSGQIETSKASAQRGVYSNGGKG